MLLPKKKHYLPGIFAYLCLSWRNGPVSPSHRLGVGRTRRRPEKRCYSPHAHERRLSSNQSRPPAATINTTMMRHGVDDLSS